MPTMQKKRKKKSVRARAEKRIEKTSKKSSKENNAVANGLPGLQWVRVWDWVWVLRALTWFR